MLHRSSDTATRYGIHAITDRLFEMTPGKSDAPARWESVRDKLKTMFPGESIKGDIDDPNAAREQVPAASRASRPSSAAPAQSIRLSRKIPIRADANGLRMLTKSARYACNEPPTRSTGRSRAPAYPHSRNGQRSAERSTSQLQLADFEAY